MKTEANIVINIMEGWKESIDYEVASEILDGEYGIFFKAEMAEKEEPSPNSVLINYYGARRKAIMELQDALTTDDREVVKAVLSNPLFRTPKNVIQTAE